MLTLDSELYATTTERLSQLSLTQRVNAELRAYKEEPAAPLASNPLTWWRSKELKYPLTVRLAGYCLTVPASSVPSDRVFSRAGQLISARRNRLKPTNVDMILLLNQNGGIIDVE